MWYHTAMPPAIDIERHARATLTIAGAADFLVADGAGVWVTNEDRVEKLRRDRARPVESVRVAHPCGGMALAAGSVWVASCRDLGLCRFDARTALLETTIPTGLADPAGELSVAAGAGSIWVLSDRSGVLSRVDPNTNAIVARIPVAPFSYAAVFGFGSVWITNTGRDGKRGRGSVQRIDPRIQQVVATIPVGPVPRFLAAGEGAVWTLNQGDGSVSRINPATNRLVKTIKVPGAKGTGGDIAAGAGRVWVRATHALLSAIDPRTNTVKARYGPPSGSGAVRVAGRWIWVTAHDVRKVWVLAAPTHPNG